MKLGPPDFGELKFAAQQSEMCLVCLIFTLCKPYISQIEALTLGYSPTKLELIFSNNLASTANNSKMVYI